MYAYIDSFRKFGKTNTDNQSIKIKRPYPCTDAAFFMRFFLSGTFPASAFCSAAALLSRVFAASGVDVRKREKALVRVGDRSVVMGREVARSEGERDPLGEGRPARQRREGRLVGRNPVRCGVARSVGRTPGCRRSPAGCISGGKAACGAGLEDQMIQIG